MYHENFWLSQPPFCNTLDTRVFYPGCKRGAILEALEYVVLQGEEIVKVVGEVGSGKTMLCRMLESRLSGKIETVFIANPSPRLTTVLPFSQTDSDGLGMSRGQRFFLAIHNAIRYHTLMIKDFRCKNTERVFRGQATKRFPQDLLKRAKMRLDRIDAAAALDDLCVPPSHHLEVMQGGRLGQHSIRINNQCRICFVWSDNGVYNVEIVDYH